MTKSEILTVVEKHLKMSVDGLKDIQIDPSKKLTEYGANSLNIVEIVSGAMRELRIKIPRTELSDIKDIDGLAEKFLKFAQ